jgi:hypothetical protein
MSRSQIACAFDADHTTVVRVKSTGTALFTMTMCRTIDGGLNDLGSTKGLKIARKLVSSLKAWREEPIALAFSPPEILTLPTWFPAGSTDDQRDRLCRIEAGYFLDDVESWLWHDMALERIPDQPAALDRRMLMFYHSRPGRLIVNELLEFSAVGWRGIHIEAVARLSAITGEPMPVLELEEHYTALYISTNGKIGYFRYWPVRNAAERDYFAVTELTSAPLGGLPVKVTGSAASSRSLDRISRETSCTIEPLELHPWVSTEKGAGNSKSPTATIRAACTAIMALNGG